MTLPRRARRTFRPIVLIGAHLMHPLDREEAREDEFDNAMANLDMLAL